MMKLRTQIPIPSQEPKIDYDAQLFMLGSCFVENIGAKLEYFKFKSLINPFGILFNPKAIETFLWMATQQERYVASDLFFDQGQWHCFDAHSRLSSAKQDQLLSDLNTALEKTLKILQETSHICITLGTAWVYRLKALDMIVANCHKIPQSEFLKELLSVEDIIQCLSTSIRLIKSINPETKMIFTVSPVRHQKDGLVENNRSKSHLLTAIHSIVDQVSNVSYFPAFEIMMDELRDYRFYKRDMLHPSEVAIDYIWERFRDAWIHSSAFQTMDRVNQIQKGLHHRPFQADGKEHREFLQNLEKKKQQLQEEYPFMSF